MAGFAAGAYAGELHTPRLDDQTALLAVLGFHALSNVFGAVFGANGNRGMVERIASLETHIGNIREAIADIKNTLGCDKRLCDGKK